MVKISAVTEFDRQRLAWWGLAAILIAGLAYASYRFVGTIVLGLFAYYATRPLYERVHTRVHSRTLAAGLSILLVTVPALLLFTWTIVVALQELLKVLSSSVAEQYLGAVEEELLSRLPGRSIDQLLSDVIGGGFPDIGGFAAGALDTFVATLAFVGSVGLHAFIVVVIAFYLLRDDYRIVAWARSTFKLEGVVVEQFFRAVDYNLKSIYFGNLVNALFTASIGVVTFNLLNLVAPPAVSIPLPALLGILVGIASLVPVVGMKIVWVPVALLLLADSLLTDPTTAWFPLLFAAVSVVIVDTVPDFVLRPYVSGRGLHVGAVMLAYIFGPLLFGWYGIFLGPLLLVLFVEFGRIVLPWLVDENALTSRTVPGQPPEARDAQETSRSTPDSEQELLDAEFADVPTEQQADDDRGQSHPE